MKVAVLGGGMAGVSIAYELSATTDVLLLEREAQLALHTTGRSAAMYLESYGNPTVRGLTAASRGDFDRLQHILDTSRLLTPRPLLWVADSDADSVSRLDAVVVAGARRLDADEARELWPALRPGRVTAAAVDDDAMEIDVLGLHQGYVRGLRARGGEIVRSASGTVRREGGGWCVGTGSGEVTVDVVVDAGGAWADEIAAGAGVRPVGLRPLRRTLFTCPVEWPTPIDGWPMLADVAERWYLKPESGGQVLASPADETPSEPCDARPDPLDVARALDDLHDTVQLGLRSVRSSWAGLRTFAPDRSPVVGYPADAPGFFWFAGQGGYGIQMAPALARVGAALVQDGDLPEDVAARGVTTSALHPDRAPVPLS